MPIEYRATEMSDIAAAFAGTARDARHLVTGRRRVPYSCNLHRNAPNIGHCEHPNVVPMRAWHRGNRPFVRLNVRLGSTSPSNDRCQRHCGTTAVGPTAACGRWCRKAALRRNAQFIHRLLCANIGNRGSRPQPVVAQHSPKRSVILGPKLTDAALPHATGIKRWAGRADLSTSPTESTSTRSRQLRSRSTAHPAP